MGIPATPLKKTETAAAYIGRTARSPLIREHAADVQRAIAVCRAAGDAADAEAALRGLLETVAECAGRAWLKANSDDPDVARFTALMDGSAGTSPAAAAPVAGELDELLAAVLWAAHGPQSAAT
jgi:hypothetical protein